jgi:hypothetical protein
MCRTVLHLYGFRNRPTLVVFAAALRARCPDHAAVVEQRIVSQQ